MSQEGTHPDLITYSLLLKSCIRANNLQQGKLLHDYLTQCGLELDSVILNSLISLYSKCGEWDKANCIFECMGDKRDLAVNTYIDMLNCGFYPKEYCYAAVIRACSSKDNVSLGQIIFGSVIKSGYFDSRVCVCVCVCVGCALIDMFVMGSGDFDSAYKMFDKMTERNVVTWTLLITRLQQLGYSYGAIDFFYQYVYAYAVKLGLASVNCVGNSLISMDAWCGDMENARKTFNVLFEKNLISYNTIVNAYAKTKQIHAWILQSGFKSGLHGSIDMHFRCGDIEAAFQVFNGMGDRNVISWTSMVTDFSKHGFAVRALETFHKMLEAAVRPNEITFIAVLSACIHVGLISEGWKHFKSMSMEHGIVPRMEHYASMEFINSLPFKADALVLPTFLGACRVHGNINLGKHAAKMILEQDPNDAGAYILLSNLYASTGQWDIVAETRKNTKERNLTKEAFYMGGTSHSQVLEIYDELDQLTLKIKELGYVPNTDFVLHDVEQEQKEQYLFQHGEKIAVAVGFISTSKFKPSRVFKNLRVCGDCYTAFKYFFSIVKGRQIVVRDSNRFHHFKDGKCSGNDYW
ncbi:hypothetical protein P3X46_018107 [Hevea brasiliensis]|uniref:DYW domain-containing protein n=1 Tax=Hevea brasiliensis TaxID=3981 RepID=A0ABQ9LQZ7_HEVBR|nr:hypothetical protein P3X46_018107 [Hevea brasiliensis]